MNTSNEEPASFAVKASSPWDIYCARLKAISLSYGAEGVMIIQGVGLECDNVNAGVEVDPTSFTAEQVASSRFILMTKSRIAAMNAAEKLMKFGQDGGSMMFGMSGTSTGNATIALIPTEVKKMMKLKTIGARFDRLFAFTRVLYCNDAWMHDNEEWEEDGMLGLALQTLGDAWKNLLKQSDE